MLSRLLGFELGFHFRQVGFWVVFAILFWLGVGYVLLDIAILGGAGERVKLNGAYTIAGLMSDMSLAALLFGAVYTVSGIMRDETYGALEIIHATPVSTAYLTLSRMVGVFLAIFLSICAGLIGVFLAQFWPLLDQAVLGPVNLVYFVYPLALFIGVNALLVTGFFTAVAGISRDRTIVYVSAIGLFMLTLIGSAMSAQEVPDWVLLFFDPLGAISFTKVVEFWSVDERNTQLVPLLSLFGVNRLLWGGLGLGLLVGTFGLFRRGLFQRSGTLATDAEDLEYGVFGESVPQNKTGWMTLWTRFRHEYLTSVRSVSFIVLMAFSMAIFAVISVLTVTLDPNAVLINNVQMSELAFVGAFLPLIIAVVFFSGEVIWRDRSTKMIELVDATPSANWPFMLGKWLAMFAVVLTFVGGAMVVGIFAQLGFAAIRKIVPIDGMVHFQNAYFNFTPRVLFLAALAMFIQNFMPTRIAGMVAAGGVLIFFVFVMPFMPFSHPMLNFGFASLGAYSDINGFSNALQYQYFVVYWTAICGLFAILTIWLWRRGLYPDPAIKRLASFKFLTHLRRVPSQISVATLMLAGLFLGLSFWSGNSIFTAYNVDGDFLTRTEQEERAVAFEALLGEQVEAPLPKIRSVETDVYFRPSLEQATVQGHYIIENTTGVPIDRLFLTIPTDSAEMKTLAVEGAVWLEEDEFAKDVAEYGVRIFELENTLPVDARARVDFITELTESKLGDRGQIRKNGTFINNYTVMPVPGVADQRLRNPDRRRKYDLDKIPLRPERTDIAARQNNFFGSVADYVDFKAKVCTDPGQVPIAPGKLQRTFEENGRACREYEAINPILFFFSYLSANYEIEQDRWTSNDGAMVDLSIYYHAEHDYNIELMIAAMKSSLDVYTELFGPYQYEQIRIMEFPYGGFAQAFAGTIPFSENLGFIQDPGDDESLRRVDFASYVTMHEIGHQWFAHQIVPANTKGFNVLSEGLTENAAMTAFERTFGWKKAKRIHEWRSIQRYLSDRVFDPSSEPALAEADLQVYLNYNKASWVFWGMKHYFGDEKLQMAIRAFLEEFGTEGPPYPTTLELIAYLREAAGPDYQQLITDYWDRITFWELSFGKEEAAVKPLEDGQFEVTISWKTDKKVANEVTGRELSVTKERRIDRDGKPVNWKEAADELQADGADADLSENAGSADGFDDTTILPAEQLNEWIEVGFYTADPKKTLGDDWIYLERINVTEIETTHTFVLPEAPTHILLDPRRLLIEVDVDDNLKVLPRQAPSLN